MFMPYDVPNHEHFLRKAGPDDEPYLHCKHDHGVPESRL